MSHSDYYVYVYIDPRNLTEFYFGKGRGQRKLAHLKDDADTEKTRTIAAIRKAGLSPTIKVIAANLTEQEALLIEKTLIWKLRKTLTNIASGHFAKKFRPPNTLHLNMPGFDYAYGVYYINVGEGVHRNWNDCRKYGFLSAGQGEKYSKPLRTLNIGDIVVAYLRSHGYVGIGKVTAQAVRIRDYLHQGKSLKEYALEEPNMFDNSDNSEKSEYVVAIKWIHSVSREEAHFKRKSNLFTSQLIKASLDNQPKTINFINEAFDVDLYALAEPVVQTN